MPASDSLLQSLDFLRKFPPQAGCQDIAKHRVVTVTGRLRAGRLHQPKLLTELVKLLSCRDLAGQLTGEIGRHDVSEAGAQQELPGPHRQARQDLVLQVVGDDRASGGELGAARQCDQPKARKPALSVPQHFGSLGRPERHAEHAEISGRLLGRTGQVGRADVSQLAAQSQLRQRQAGREPARQQ